MIDCEGLTLHEGEAELVGFGDIHALLYPGEPARECALKKWLLNLQIFKKIGIYYNIASIIVFLIYSYVVSRF